MKECDKRNSHISSKLRMIYMSSNNDRHPVTKTVTPLHYTCRQLTPSHLNFTQLHFTILSFGLTSFKFPTAPVHLTSLHYYLTSINCTFRRFSPHFYSFHFTPFIIAFLTPFLKILGLQRKVAASAGSWFQFVMILFTKKYFPISVLCFLSLIFRTLSTLPQQ